MSGDDKLTGCLPIIISFIIFILSLIGIGTAILIGIFFHKVESAIIMGAISGVVCIICIIIYKIKSRP